ncbi:neuroligin-4, X-linked [Caerostris darwini]|uniref:Neuroligin-4, X-linked n=1 Tax=Caerostris darwini TaxID=1538125 RepID=A0AAV4Q6S9_9ARAC|nr:neuroligin-4, X-linked [Caerostris darwini]
MPLRSMILRFILIFCVLKLSSSAEQKKLTSRVVNTKYGSLRGYVTTLPNRSWRPVEIYKGVPYASPPIGSLRFMPPVTPAHWRGIKMVDKFSPVCPQKLPDIKNETEALKRMPTGRLDHLKRLIPLLQNQSEDCLYLNIYVPALGKHEISILNFLSIDFKLLLNYVSSTIYNKYQKAKLILITAK